MQLCELRFLVSVWPMCRGINPEQLLWCMENDCLADLGVRGRADVSSIVSCKDIPETGLGLRLCNLYYPLGGIRAKISAHPSEGISPTVG